MLASPISDTSSMFDTLTFSKKMQKVGMDKMLADELAISLRDIHVNHFDLLLTREEFKKSEQKIHNDFKDFKNEIRNELKDFKDEIQSDLKEFKDEMQNDFREFKDEMQLDFKKFKEEIYIELTNRLKNLELNITIKMGIMMTTAVSVIGLMIKI